MRKVKGISAAGWFYQQSFVSGGLQTPKEDNPEDAKQSEDKPKTENKDNE